MWNEYDLSDFSIEELLEEVQSRRRKLQSKQTLFYSPSHLWIAELAENKNDGDLYIKNGGWYGSHDRPNFIIHAPHGNEIKHNVTWIEFTKDDVYDNDDLPNDLIQYFPKLLSDEDEQFIHNNPTIIQAIK